MSEQEKVDQAAPTERPVVLVAEDEVLVRNIVSVILESAGYEVLAAVDGQDAIDISRTYPGKISVLLTDLVMPRMDGNELVARIVPERPEIKVVAMSGYASGGVEPQNHAVPFLRKPFVPAALLHVVAGVMNRQVCD